MSSTRFFLSSVALASSLFIFGAPSAIAADLPTYKAAPVVAPVNTWTGAYFGVVGGYGWGKSTQFDPEIETSAEEIVEAPDQTHGHGHGNYNVSGGTIGGTAGYNLQFDPSWLVGIEADASWANIRGSQTDCGFPVGTNNGCGSKVNEFGTLRGRLGYVAGPFMVFGSAGLAVANVNAYSNIGGNPAGTNTLGGWTVGAGAEFQFAGHWTAKLEYLYAKFDQDYVYNVEPGVREQVGLQMNIVRAGINYRF